MSVTSGRLAQRAGGLRRWWPAAALALLDLLLGAWWLGGRGSPLDAAPEPQRLSAQVDPGRIHVVETPSAPAPAGRDAPAPAGVAPSAPAFGPVPAPVPAVPAVPPLPDGAPR